MIQTREEVEEICLSVVKERLFDYEFIKAELDSLKNGDRVLLPTSKEHAKMMLIVAMNYLGIEPNQPISYTKD